MQLTLAWLEQNATDPRKIRISLDSGTICYDPDQVQELVDGVSTVVAAPNDPTARVLAEALRDNVAKVKAGVLAYHNGHWVVPTPFTNTNESNV